jgi:folate-binding protein YgfZ
MAPADPNPFIQQRLLASGDAFIDRTDRCVIRLSGSDRLTWLDGLVSQHVRDLPVGESTETLILTPQGRVEYQLAVVDDGTTTHMIVNRGPAAALAEWFDRMIFSADVEVALVPEVRVLGAFAGRAAVTLESVSTSTPVIVWHDPWGTVTAGGVQYALGEHPGNDWTYGEALVSSDDLPGVRSSLAEAGITEVTRDAWDALRVAAWRPTIEAEGDDTLIPHEVDWMRSAVHLNKGCYRGQETVAKVHNLGAPPRRLVLLHLDGMSDALPDRGAEISHDEKVVGHVTSAVRHGQDGLVALALVKRNLPVAATLDVVTGDGTVRATQVVVVPPTAGHAVTVERLPRVR